MSEVPRVTQSGHNMNETIEKTVQYSDGSVHVEIDKVAATVDLNKSYSKHLNFNAPASITGFTTVDYDGNKKVYVLTEGGYGESVQLTYPVNGKAEYAVGEIFDEQWVSSLRAAPLTIGARHGRFNDEKLMSVAGLKSVGEDIDGSNPLAVAGKILEQRQ